MTCLRNLLPENPQSVAPDADFAAPRFQRYDIFKGVLDDDGKVQKVRSVGQARLAEGYKTFIIQLKTFVNDEFYMLPERPSMRSSADYTLLTREESLTPGRKYHWNKVGEGTMLDLPNANLMHLSWDLFGTDDLYLNMVPIEREPALGSSDVA